MTVHSSRYTQSQSERIDAHVIRSSSTLPCHSSHRFSRPKLARPTRAFPAFSTIVPLSTSSARSDSPEVRGMWIFTVSVRCYAAAAIPLENVCVSVVFCVNKSRVKCITKCIKIRMYNVTPTFRYFFDVAYRLQIYCLTFNVLSLFI